MEKHEKLQNLEDIGGTDIPLNDVVNQLRSMGKTKAHMSFYTPTSGGEFLASKFGYTTCENAARELEEDCDAISFGKVGLARGSGHYCFRVFSGPEGRDNKNIYDGTEATKAYEVLVESPFSR